ncbi:MAG: extracellular solute-binding protein [Anaerolineaceae bacterium]|nr:extracellular solute-binding protein [Chloroflexota bacterium]
MYKKRYLIVVLVLVAVLTLAACQQKAAPDVDTGALPETNKLVIYSPNSENLLNAVIPAFEAKYGVKVEVISAGTGEVFKRLEGEKNNPYADIVYGGAYATFMNNPDLFQEYVSPNNENVIDAYKNTTGYITPYVLDGSIILVNKSLVGDIEINGYKDLLNPALAGKIVSANPTASSSAYAHLTNMLNAIGKGDYESEEAWQFVADLFANTVVIDSSSAVWKGVRDGEYTVGLSYEDPSATLVRDGADVEVIYMEEGAVFLPAGSGIVKGAKNLLNAQRFIDMITSEEIQNVFSTTMTNRPVIANVETPDYMTPFKDINVIEEDMEYCYVNKDKISDHFKEIYVSNQ